MKHKNKESKKEEKVAGTSHNNVISITKSKHSLVLIITNPYVIDKGIIILLFSKKKGSLTLLKFKKNFICILLYTQPTP